LDAEILLAYALGCQRIDLYTSYESVPSDEARATFRQLVLRRAAGEPVAYLVGRREFYCLSFRVNSHVLIPRPETELLVVTLLELARQWPHEKPLRICDVGTGSGIVAICAAKHLPRCSVIATDISPQALAVARMNAEEHGVAERIRFVESDLLCVLAPEERFAFLVSNPPYVREDEFADLPVEVRQFEPRHALVAGPQGTEIIQRLLPQAAERLVSAGYLLLEISPRLHEEIRQLIASNPHFELGETREDLARLPRVVLARKK